jgi:Sec-independent protein translocase protein TatA
VGFGTEGIFLLLLGFLFLGPKQLQGLLKQVARVKAQIAEASRSLESQIAGEISSTHEKALVDAISAELISAEASPKAAAEQQT